MDLATATLFVPACLALNMAPGPNNLLSLSNATHHGFIRSCLAGLGRLLAFVGMIALVSAGLAVVLQSSVLVFYGIKFAGAAYLFYLAVQLWRANPKLDTETGHPASLLDLARQEFLVALGNPKAMLIFTAFLPQFVDSGRPAGAQFFVLGATFLALEWIAIAAYAWMGLHLRRWFADARSRRIFNRGCSALLLGAGVGLLAARRS